MMMMTPLAARAETNFFGNVAAARSISVSAPYGGTTEDFSLREGDAVKAGDKLFTVKARAVYAPAAGVVSGVRAQPGDDAAFIQDLYGALLYITKPGRFYISTSTREAHNKNVFVKLGETVYLKERSSSSHTGEGFVSKVKGESYTVEVTSGNLRLNKTVDVCRKKSRNRSSRIGRGKTMRLDDVAVTGEGSVFRLYVKEGDEVTRGDLVAEMVDGTLEGLIPPSGEACCSVDALVASVTVEAGAKVEKDQVLATLYPMDAMQVEATVF